MAVLAHSLEEKGATAELERVRSKSLQAELARMKDSEKRLLLRAESGENALWGLKDFVRRISQRLLGKEAEVKAAMSRLAGLGNRVAFAAKRIDTIQGLLSQKIALVKLQQEENSRAAQSSKPNE
uniref:Coiled-coil alpha-helical rod protein 1 n=1 Tax=Sphenodon punctatus TaxID=8508 RepID=A0A8D0L6K4_SPHPU